MQTPIFAAPPATRRLLASAETAEGTVILSVCESSAAHPPHCDAIDLQTARQSAAAIIGAAQATAAQMLSPIAAAGSTIGSLWDGVERRSIENARLVLVERRNRSAA